MPNKKIKSVKSSRTQHFSRLKNTPEESDSTFFLKLVIYIICGAIWLKFAHPFSIGSFTLNGFPIGLVIGLLFASHDHFQINRKIAYTVLILMTILSYFLPVGILL